MNDRTEELETELVLSLKTFGRLYDQQAELLNSASDGLEQTAASVCHSFGFLVAEVGKAVTCLLGGFSGGIFGTISALVWSEGHAEDLTFGIVGSILGGVAGGALGGAISGAVTILSKLARVPVRDVNSEMAWLFGFAVGGVAGGAFGGPLGATGGAMGGVLGAFCAVQCAVNANLRALGSVLAGLKHAETRWDKSLSDGMRCCLGDFRESLKPLLEQLKNIQTVCRKMAPHHHHVHTIDTQAAASLEAAAKMEAEIGKAGRTSSLFELVSGVTAAANLSKSINKELKGLRRKVETFPHPPSRTPEGLPTD